MEKPRQEFENLRKKVTEDHDFEELLPYEDPKVWKTLNTPERLILAELFLFQGKKFLEMGVEEGLGICDIAKDIVPENLDVILQHATAYVMHVQDALLLKDVIAVLDQIVERSPELIPALRIRAEAYRRLGEESQDIQVLQLASADFEKCALLLKKAGALEDNLLLWRWGVVCHLIGKMSGEPDDYLRALSFYQTALSRGECEANFYADFGFTCGELGYLLHREDLLVQASEWFQKACATRIDPPKRVLINWAAVEFYLFMKTAQDVHFKLSLKAIEWALKEDPSNPDLWLKWGQLLLQAGKMKKNLEHVRHSLSKFEQAYHEGLKDDPNLLGHWGEALITLGGHSEDIDLLQAGEDKIQEALLNAPYLGFLWYLSAHAAIEKGHYFQDTQFYSLAIERFQSGLVVDEANPRLWQGLAEAYTTLGVESCEPKIFEKANQTFQHVLEHEPHPDPIFWNEWGLMCMKMGDLVDSPEWLHLAAEKFSSGIESITTLNKEGQVDPEWYYNWGCTQQILGDMLAEASYYEKAIQLYTKVLSLDSNNSHARISLAVVLAHLGDLVGEVDCLQKAGELFEQYLAKEPEDEHIWNEWGEALLNYAILVHDPAQPERFNAAMRAAEQRFQNAARLGSPVAYLHLASHAAMTGHPVAAIEFLKKAHHLDAIPGWLELLEQDSLKSLHDHPLFIAFVEELKADFGDDEDEGGVV